MAEQGEKKIQLSGVAQKSRIVRTRAGATNIKSSRFELEEEKTSTLLGYAEVYGVDDQSLYQAIVDGDIETVKRYDASYYIEVESAKYVIVDSLILGDTLKQDKLYQNSLGGTDFTRSFSEEDRFEFLDVLTDEMVESHVIELQDRIDQKCAPTAEDILNELRSFCEESDMVYQDVLSAIAKVSTVPSYLPFREEMLRKYDLTRSGNIYDLAYSDMCDLINELGQRLSEEAFDKWTEQIDKEAYRTSADAVYDLLHNSAFCLDEDTIKELESIITKKIQLVAATKEPYEQESEDDLQDKPKASKLDEYKEDTDLDDEYSNENSEEDLDDVYSNENSEEDLDDVYSNENSEEDLIEYSNEGTEESSSNDVGPEDTREQEIDDMIESLNSELEQLDNSIDSMMDSADTDDLSDMEMDMTADDYRTMMQQLSENTQMGDALSSLMQRNLQDIYKVKIAWYKKLEKMFMRFLPGTQSTYALPNKNYLHLNVILPSNSGKDDFNAIERVDLYLDSSGSMSEKDLSITKSLLSKMSKQLPKKTRAYEFNTTLRELKVRNGRLLEDPSATGGTDINRVLKNLKKKDSGKVLSIVVTDGGFNWSDLYNFLDERPKEKMAIVLTQDCHGYKSEYYKKYSRRFLVVQTESLDIQDKVVGW